MNNKILGSIKKAAVGFALAGVLSGGLGLAGSSPASAAKSVAFDKTPAISKTACKNSASVAKYFYGGITNHETKVNYQHFDSERGKSASETCTKVQISSGVIYAKKQEAIAKKELDKAKATSKDKNKINKLAKRYFSWSYSAHEAKNTSKGRYKVSPATKLPTIKNDTNTLAYYLYKGSSAITTKNPNGDASKLHKTQIAKAKISQKAFKKNIAFADAKYKSAKKVSAVISAPTKYHANSDKKKMYNEQVRWLTVKKNLVKLAKNAK